MAIFSTNQVRQLYVVNKAVGITTPANAGDIVVKSDKDKTHLYFSYKGAGDENGVMRSDLIDIKNILYAKSTSAAKMARPLKSVTVSLDASVNGGQPVSGQDYIVRVAFRQFVGMSDEDQYFKYGMVHAYAGMKAPEFYEKLAASLWRNFSREISKLVKFTIAGKDVEGVKVVDGVTKCVDKAGAVINTTTATGVTITELVQPYRHGAISQVPVYFEVQGSPVTVLGDEMQWAKVVAGTSGSVGNGTTIADLEYFCMGERGDQYRQVGWPHTIDTKYLVDPSKTYHTFDIHYAYVGDNQSVQKSEKDITIVCSTAAELNKVIADFKAATGLQVEDVA